MSSVKINGTERVRLLQGGIELDVTMAELAEAMLAAGVSGLTAPTLLTISGSMPGGTVNSNYAFAPTLSGGKGRRRFRLETAPPPGLTFNSSTGGFEAGSPTRPGKFEVTITAWDDTGPTTFSDVLVVALSQAGGYSTLYYDAPQAANLYYAASGFRLPNSTGSIGAGKTQFGQYMTYQEGLYWDVPTGGKVEWSFVNFTVAENDTSNHNEDAMPNDFTIRVGYMYYTDASGTARTVQCALSNGGVAQAGVLNGGVRMTATLPGGYKKGTAYTLGLGVQVADGGRVPSHGPLRVAGDAGRSHATDNFDALLASKAALAGLAGSTNASWSGNYLHPVCVRASNSDGRPSVINYGDSHSYGKGYEHNLVSPTGTAGLIEIGLARSSGAAYKIGSFNISIAGSGATADITVARTNTMALIDAHAAVNGGVDPFHFYITNEGSNTAQASVASWLAMMNTRNGQWKSYRNHPVLMTTQIQKLTNSTDGLRTYAGQTPNGAYLDGGAAFGFNDLLMAGGVSSVSYAVDVYTPIKHATSRDRFSIRPFTASLTRATLDSDTTIYLDAGPTVGEALCLDPLSGAGQSRIVTAVSPSGTAGEWAVVTDVGSSAGAYPAKPVGTAVGAHWVADGKTYQVGLHVSYLAHLAIAPQFDAMKAAIKAAVSGTWTDTVVSTPTVGISSAISQNEGNSGTTTYVYTVTRSAAAGAVAIPWTFAAGTTDATDFVGGLPAGGTLNLADGVASGTITINVAGDTTVESNESFTVSITPPSGYTAGTATSATGTIVNDDSAGIVATSQTAPAPATTGAASFTFTGAAIGTASTARDVLVSVSAYASAARVFATTNPVTVDGVTATLVPGSVVYGDASGTNRAISAMYRATLDTTHGGTGDIVVAMNATCISCAVEVEAVTGISSLGAVATFTSAAGASPATTDVAYVNGSVIFVGVSYSSAATSGNRKQAIYKRLMTGSGTLTVTPTWAADDFSVAGFTEVLDRLVSTSGTPNTAGFIAVYNP